MPTLTPLPLFFRFILRYTMVFIAAIVFISIIRWTLFVKMNTIFGRMEVIFWITYICPFSYLFFRKILNSLEFQKRAKYGSILIIIPATCTIAGIACANYFIDKSYSIVHVNKPSDILQLPGERYFRIEKMNVLPDNYFCINEYRTINKYGDREYARHYIVPIYDNIAQSDTLPLSVIGYGISFSKQIHSDRGLNVPILTRYRIDSQDVYRFYQQSEIDYNLYDFNDVDYFERITNKYEALRYYEKAWAKNQHFAANIKPVILEKRKGTLADVSKTDLNNLIWSVILSYLFAIAFFKFFDYMKYTEMAGYSIFKE